jgi:hypothetical protein
VISAIDEHKSKIWDPYPCSLVKRQRIPRTQPGQTARPQQVVGHAAELRPDDAPLCRPDVLQQNTVIRRKIAPRRAHAALGKRRPIDIRILICHHQQRIGQRLIRERVSPRRQ